MKRVSFCGTNFIRLFTTKLLLYEIPMFYQIPIVHENKATGDSTCPLKSKLFTYEKYLFLLCGTLPYNTLY